MVDTELILEVVDIKFKMVILRKHDRGISDFAVDNGRVNREGVTGSALLQRNIFCGRSHGVNFAPRGHWLTIRVKPPALEFSPKL